MPVFLQHGFSLLCCSFFSSKKLIKIFLVIEKIRFNSGRSLSESDLIVPQLETMEMEQTAETRRGYIILYYPLGEAQSNAERPSIQRFPYIIPMIP